MGDLITQKSVTLAAGTLTELLPPQNTGQRVAWYVRKVTTDANECSLGLDRDAVAGEGITFGAGGSTTDSNSGDAYKCFQGRVTAISTAGTTVSVFMRARA